MKLYQISSGDELTQQVVRKMVERSSLLTFAEFYSITGNAEYARKQSSSSAGMFRGLDSDFGGNLISPIFENPTLKILGDQIQVDIAHERRGMDVSSLRASELLNFAMSLGKQFQNYFFNGDSSISSVEFDGIKKLIPSGQKITASTNGLSVDTGNSDTAKIKQQKYLELLESLIESIDGGAQVIVMDGKTLSRTTTIARDFITTHANEFGVPVKYFNGIPLIPAGYDKSGTRILPHNETVGTSNTCTSVYAVRFGERSDLSFATNLGVEVKDLGVVSNFYVHRLELDLCPVLLNDKAVARLEGIIIS